MGVSQKKALTRKRYWNVGKLVDELINSNCPLVVSFVLFKIRTLKEEKDIKIRYEEIHARQQSQVDGKPNFLNYKYRTHLKLIDFFIKTKFSTFLLSKRFAIKSTYYVCNTHCVSLSGFVFFVVAERLIKQN